MTSGSSGPRSCCRCCESCSSCSPPSTSRSRRWRRLLPPVPQVAVQGPHSLQLSHEQKQALAPPLAARAAGGRAGAPLAPAVPRAEGLAVALARARADLPGVELLAGPAAVLGEGDDVAEAF